MPVRISTCVTTAKERQELEKHLRVGSLINILQAKARLSLKSVDRSESYPMAVSRRQRVWERAGGRCEYCRMPQELDVQPFQLDHMRAQKHAGPTTVANLALSCLPCNSYKGADVAGYDPASGELQRLFNPRHDDWDGPVLRAKRRSVEQPLKYCGSISLGAWSIGGC